MYVNFFQEVLNALLDCRRRLFNLLVRGGVFGDFGKSAISFRFRGGLGRVSDEVNKITDGYSQSFHYECKVSCS